MFKVFKKITYKIIKPFLIILFLHTPLFYLVERIVFKFRFRRSFFLNIIYKIYFAEYFAKLKDPEKMKEISLKNLINEEGVKWAKKEYENPYFLNLNDLNKPFGNLTYGESYPVFFEIVDYIKNNKLQNEELYIIQLGSCSGRDLEFFYNLFPNLKYISTDISQSMLNFQREIYQNKFEYVNSEAENIDDIINNLNLSNKKILIFSDCSLQYLSSYSIQMFFKKLKKIEGELLFFMNEPIDLPSYDKLNRQNLTSHKGLTAFTHNYNLYAKKNNLKIEKNFIIKPFISGSRVTVGIEYLLIKKF